MTNYKYFFKRANEPRLELLCLSNKGLRFQLQQEGRASVKLRKLDDILAKLQKPGPHDLAAPSLLFLF